MNFKNALVAGTGKSGISAAKLLIAHGVKVTLFDENEKRDKNDLMEKFSRSELVTILLGKLTDEVLKQTDIMVISPGIPVDSAFVEEVKKQVFRYGVRLNLHIISVKVRSLRSQEPMARQPQLHLSERSSKHGIQRLS